MASGTSQMRAVPDGVGTAPFGVRLAPDGQAVYVANYLARNVGVAASAEPTESPSGKPASPRGSAEGAPPCATSNDCAGGPDCGPPLLGGPVPSIRGPAGQP